MAHFKSWTLASLAVIAVVAAAPASHAGTVRPAFDDNIFARNDDGSTGPVSPGFSMDFFGVTHTSFYINNNGNITFNSPLGTFTPFGITGGSTPMIAPFFADVDTRGPGDPVTYGTDSVGGRSAFAVNWVNVGHYSAAGPLNSFQLVLIDRADTGAGNFDIEFNYDQILWEAGTASGSNGLGLGGTAAVAGWTNGAGTFFQLPGSMINGAFLDSNSTTGLIHTSNIGVDGRWLFSARNGSVVQGESAPAPGALALVGLGLLGIGVIRRRA